LGFDEEFLCVIKFNNINYFSGLIKPMLHNKTNLDFSVGLNNGNRSGNNFLRKGFNSLALANP
jgi:hypothetical protein